MLALTPGCGEREPWAERAVQWIQARDRAAHHSVADWVMFESADTVHVFCCNNGGPIQGRETLASIVAGEFGESIDEATMARSFVDVSGAVVEYLVREGPSVYRPPGGGFPLGPDEVQVSDIDAKGAATRTVHAMSLQFLEAPVDDGRAPYGKELRAAQALADRYLSAWSGRDGREVAGLYAQNATVLDSVLGVQLTGREAIASYATEHGGARLRQGSIVSEGGPALYGSWGDGKGGLTAYLIYTGHDRNDCPGGVAAELQIEQGRIVAERRFHDVSSMRRCASGTELPDGWWTNAVIAPLQDRVTGTVTAAGQRIEIRNGNAAADDLVRWSMARFPAAGLSVPAVASVAFSREAQRAECSGDDRGWAVKTGSDFRVYLCLTVDGTAPPSARELMLHELAHVWMWQNLPEPVQRQFVTRMQLPTWDATDVPWDRRGIELAAGVVAWGLSDAPVTNRLLTSRSCADLADTFKLLTGAAPLRPPCPPGS